MGRRDFVKKSQHFDYYIAVFALNYLPARVRHMELPLQRHDRG
jgi:hypothetical protein